MRAAPLGSMEIDCKLAGIQIPWCFPLHYMYIRLLGDIRLCISWAFPIYSLITWYSFTETGKYSWYSFIMDIRLLGTWE